MAIKNTAGTMDHTYTKRYNIQQDPHSPVRDHEWLKTNFGPTSYALLSFPRWTRLVASGIGNDLSIEYWFKNRDDYTLFVLSCGDR